MNQNRLASLQLCGQLNLLAPLLSTKSTYQLQRAMLYSLHPSHSKTNSRCFAQMFAMQTAKPSFALVDFKFVLK
ncbi:MAG TPA: hypothetical protein PKV27_12215, partial [Ilumatobacteraceae bacterium]|nr:hypothetical protein [Ilumatobacteraceae bacterium]